jgi:hypothetical protein
MDRQNFCFLGGGEFVQICQDQRFVAKTHATLHR